MKNMNLGRLSIGLSVAAYAYLGGAVNSAHATSDCRQFGVDSVANGEYAVATNAFSLNGTQCIDYNATTGDFSITTNTSTGLDYPHIIRGQSYGEGPTTASGMPVVGPSP